MRTLSRSSLPRPRAPARTAILKRASLLAATLGCADAPTPPPAGDRPDPALRVVVVDTALATGAAAVHSRHATTDERPATALATVAVAVHDLLLGADDSFFRTYAVAVNDRGDILGATNGWVLWNARKPTQAPRVLVPPLPAGDAVALVDLNSAGQIAGSRSAGGTGPGELFVWTPGGALRTYAYRSEFGAESLVPSAMNDRGQVIGYVAARPDGKAGQRPFLWDPAQGLVELGSLGDAVRDGVARGINAAGRVVGSSGDRAFVWTLSDGMRALDDASADAGVVASDAADVNDAGEVVGWRTDRDLVTHATFWDASGDAHDLGALDPVVPWDLANESRATAINNRGQVVGSSLVLEEQHSAFLWQRETGMVDLGCLNWEGPGQDFCEPVDINNSAFAVGWTGRREAGGIRATLWLIDIAGEGAPRVDRVQAARLPPGVYAAHAPNGGVWLRVRLTDADTPTPGPWAWRIDWGDGVVHTPTVAIKGEFAFARAAPYATPGPHTITVAATDPGGATSPIATTIAP